MIGMEFWEWMTAEYIKWRGNSRATISEFAQHIGVKQQVMSSWMKRGGKAPSASSLAKIASKLGLEVYDVLGLPRPLEPTGSPADLSRSQLPPVLQSALHAATSEINAIYASRHVAHDSPEAVSIAVEILQKHGFTITRLTAVPDND